MLQLPFVESPGVSQNIDAGQNGTVVNQFVDGEDRGIKVKCQRGSNLFC